MQNIDLVLKTIHTNVDKNRVRLAEYKVEWKAELKIGLNKSGEKVPKLVEDHIALPDGF